MCPKTCKALVAEFVGTFALVFIGIGAIAHLHGAGDLLGIALAHGLAIAVMVSATGAISGGHLNPAVTAGAWVAGKIEGNKAIAYVLAQLAGGTVAAYLAGLSFSSLYGELHKLEDVVKLGTPALGDGIGQWRGMMIEAILTFLLVFVVFGTGIDDRRPPIGGLAIGATVALDILFGGPLTGAAMNPARVFGPALVSGHWDHHLVYWAGPIVGGVVAGVVYGKFLIHKD